MAFAKAVRSVLGDAEAAPFLKWVGGKRQLLPQIVPHLPRDFGVYHEPFLGGGALYFHLRPARAYLGDCNGRLVRTYRGVRNRVQDVVTHLQEHARRHDRAYYEQVRAHPVDDGSDAEVAAWMIYLNRTGFNGLYRVNRRNAVNVPFGRYVNPNICDEPRLRACARQLKRAFIHEEGFEAVLERAEKNDLVYFDPPYVPLTKTSNFTSYTSRGFGRAEHERLAEVARTLKRRKVKVVLSNSSAPLVRELYRDFTLHEVQASRMVNSKASARGAVTELLIVG